MFEKDSGPISRILAEDFTWNILSHKDGAKANKQQTILWNLKTKMVQSDYNTIYNGDEVAIETFNLSSEGRPDMMVLSIGHLTEDGSQVIACEHLTGPYTEGMKGSGLGFLL